MRTRTTIHCEGAALTRMSFPILIRSGQGGCRLEPRAGAERRLRGDKAAAVVLNETLWKATDPDCLNCLPNGTRNQPPTPMFRMKPGKENLQYPPATEGGLPGMVAGHPRYWQRIHSSVMSAFAVTVPSTYHDNEYCLLHSRMILLHASMGFTHDLNSHGLPAWHCDGLALSK